MSCRATELATLHAEVTQLRADVAQLRADVDIMCGHLRLHDWVAVAPSRWMCNVCAQEHYCATVPPATGCL